MLTVVLCEYLKSIFIIIIFFKSRSASSASTASTLWCFKLDESTLAEPYSLLWNTVLNLLFSLSNSIFIRVVFHLLSVFTFSFLLRGHLFSILNDRFLFLSVFWTHAEHLDFHGCIINLSATHEENIEVVSGESENLSVNFGITECFQKSKDASIWLKTHHFCSDCFIGHFESSKLFFSWTFSNILDKFVENIQSSNCCFI